MNSFIEGGIGGINVTGPTSAPNVTIVNTVSPMMTADAGVRIRGPNPRWPSPNPGQQLPTQMQNQLQQPQQSLPGQMQAANQVRQPSQIQMPQQSMQIPLQQQQQQQQQAMLQNQQVPQVLNQNTLPNSQNTLPNSVLQQPQPMSMPLAANPVQQAQAQVQLQGPQQTPATGQMIINPQQQQMQQQGVRPFGAPQGLVNQLNQGQGMFNSFKITLTIFLSRYDRARLSC